MKTQNYYTQPVIRDPGICDLSLPLRIVSAGAVSEVPYSNKRTRLDWYLIYVLKGSLYIELCEKTYCLNSGSMILISPDTSHFHYTKNNETVDYLWIHFTGYNSRHISKHFRISPNIPHFAGINHSISENWQRLFNTIILNDDFLYDVSSAILTEIMADFSRYIHNTNHKNNFLKSISYIHKHFSEDLSVTELAKMEGLSQSHYRTIFKEITGISPADYITLRRIENASKLLENTNMSLSEIAASSGYNDVYYFIRMFKKKAGITPAKYRKITNIKK